MTKITGFQIGSQIFGIFFSYPESVKPKAVLSGHNILGLGEWFTVLMHVYLG